MSLRETVKAWVEEIEKDPGRFFPGSEEFDPLEVVVCRSYPSGDVVRIEFLLACGGPTVYLEVDGASARVIGFWAGERVEMATADPGIFNAWVSFLEEVGA